MQLKDRFGLAGKTALVTGSSRGIGRGIALGLAEYGAHLVLHGSRESDALREAECLVGEFDPAVETWIADLGDSRAAGTMPMGIDVLVANVSIQERMAWHEFDINEARHEMEVNWLSTLRLFQIAYPHMKENGWGRFIVVGSVQERRPHPMMVAYAGTKGALENMVRNIARQVASEGITVNNLCPGVFATDRNKDALDNPEYAKKVLDAIPMHRAADPSDAAGAAVLLASDAGRYITGSTIMIDGGLSLPG
ncbi:MAG: SDR family oxidoreductase [Kiritimatiellae bacterium]|nr:SDR family oxidoreductase [Kiritimatiellia bacterium]